MPRGTVAPHLPLHCAPMPEAAPATTPEPRPAEPLAGPPGAPADTHLERKLVRGIAWTGGMKWATQVVAWGSTLVLARLLSPEDYGLVGMAALFLGLVSIFTEFGIGSAIINHRELTGQQVSQLHGAAVLLGVAGMVGTTLAAWPLGLYFRRPDELPPAIVALSVTFLIMAFRSVPQAVLQRDLRFKALAAVEGIEALVYSAANIAFALLGFRYWSLVLGGLTAKLLGTVLTNSMSRVPLARPTRAGLGGMLGFSRDLMVGRLAWYTYTNADFAVAGRMLGAATLGAYSLAWTLASVPVDKISALVTRVTPAFFGRLKHDHAGLRRLLTNVTEGIAWLTLPASVGLAAVAGEFVPLVLGPGWDEAVLPLQLLSLYATFRSVVTLPPQVLTAKGDTRFLMWNGVATALVLPGAFWFGSRWGAGGIAIMWLLAYPAFIVPLYRRTLRAIELPLWEYLAQLRVPVLGSLVMLLVVLAAKAALPAAWPAALRLAAEVAAGAVAFGLAAVLPARARLSSLFRLIRNPAAPAAAPTGA